MTSGISVVINTRNEEKSLPLCLASVKSFAAEVVVVDMASSDHSVEVAKKFGATVVSHKFLPWVEPARNFAVKKARGPWIMVLDPDEEVPPALGRKLSEISQSNQADYVTIPRRNIVFGKWIKSSRWWPDYLIRFFQKGSVTWSDQIHLEPTATGSGLTLPAEEQLAIIHHHYDSLTKFLLWSNRYAEGRATRLKDESYQFTWPDLINKPAGEFLSRYFFGAGYQDGLHGLALAILQAFAEFLVYVKYWEGLGFPQTTPDLSQVDKEVRDVARQYRYWRSDSILKVSRNPAEIIKHRFIRKIASTK